MAKKKKAKIRLNPKVIVGVFTPILLLLGLIQIAQGFIDTRNYRDQIIEAIKIQTGREVSIKGTVKIALLPTPTIYVPGMELRDPDSAQPAPAISADMVYINIKPLSALNGNPQISGIVLDHPVLELVRAQDNLIHWDWLNGSLLKALNNKSTGSSISLQISEGKILYHDSRSDRGLAIEHINTSFTGKNQLEMGGGFSIYGHDVQFSMDTEGDTQPVDGPVPFHFKASSGGHSGIDLKGSLDLSGELPVVNGKLVVGVENVLAWAKAKTDEQHQLLEQVTNQLRRKKDEAAPIPLKMSGEWVQQGLSVDMNDLELQGVNSIGKGTIKLTWNEWQPVLAADMAFSVLDYNQWKKLLMEAFQESQEAMAERLYKGVVSQSENPLPQDFQIALHLSADKFYFGSQVWEKAILSADMAEAAVTVNQFSIALPGESTLTMFGIVSEAPAGGLRFEGSLETQGKSLRQMLTVFDESATDLPETGFGDFYLRSNIFISSKQMRLSEADVKLSDLHLNGGLVAYHDTYTRLEAEVKLRKINFDYFRDIWREKRKHTDKLDFFLKFDKALNLNWLKKLQTAIDFKVSVDDFTLLERHGDTASFRLYVRGGELAVYDMNFNYPTDSLKGSFNFNANGDEPYISLALSTSEINTNYFNLDTDNESKNNEEEKDEKAPITTPNVEPLTDGKTLEITPQSRTFVVAQADDALPSPHRPAENIQDIIQFKKKVAEANENSQKRWPEELIDMSWIDGFSGIVDLSIGRLTHKEIALNNLQIKATFKNDLVNFQNVNFDYWQGKCTILGSIYGGKVPGIAISYTLYNAELYDILKSLTNRDNITGKINITGTMNTSGVNYLSWISQSEAKLVLAARGVNVQGLNLQSVMDTVGKSRTAADVFNNVPPALLKGSSYMSVDGNINVKNGILRTPGITLKTETVIGDLIGDVRLIPWTMDLSMLFQFPALTSETVPTMTVQLSGPLEKPEIRTDTASLEAYVAKRIISK